MEGPFCPDDPARLQPVASALGFLLGIAGVFVGVRLAVSLFRRDEPLQKIGFVERLVAAAVSLACAIVIMIMTGIAWICWWRVR